MSRSYRKQPYITEQSSNRCPRYKREKTYANHKVRRNGDIFNNGLYKRVFESWIINDYSLYMSESQLRREWSFPDSRLRSRFRTYKEAYRWWYTSYKRK